MIDIGVRCGGLDTPSLNLLAKEVKKVSRKSLQTRVHLKKDKEWVCIWAVPEKDYKKVENVVKNWAQSVILLLNKSLYVAKIFKLDVPDFLKNLLYKRIFFLGFENESQKIRDAIDCSVMVDIPLLMNWTLKDMTENWKELVEPIIEDGGISENATEELLGVYSQSIKPKYDKATIYHFANMYWVKLANKTKANKLKTMKLNAFEKLEETIEFAYEHRGNETKLSDSLTDIERTKIQKICNFKLLPTN